MPNVSFDLGIKKSSIPGVWLRKPSFATVADWLDARKQDSPHRAHAVFLRGTLCDAQGGLLWETPAALMDEIPHGDMLTLLSEAMAVSGIDDEADDNSGNAGQGETD